MIQGYLLSLLSRQRALLNERFDARYPHAWLVWEPGARLKPASAEELEIGKTKLPTPRDHAMHPVGNDAVCFPLPVPTKESNCLVLGRHVDSSIVIDDMSVSREHARLFVRSGRWELEPIGYGVVHLSGVPVHGGRRIPMQNAFTLLLGGVTLTFYERGKLVERLLAEEKRQASSTAS